MINQERVKQLYKIALYEQKEEKHYEATGQFFKSDFVGIQVVKSIFSGTIAYGLMVVIWVLCNLENIAQMLLNFEIFDTVLKIGVIYIVFLLVYLFLTILIYHVRYKKGRKKLEEYMNDLRTVEKMYERDEKLKM